MKCCLQQFRFERVCFVLYTFQESPTFSSATATLLPETQFNLLPLLLMHFIKIRSTAVLSYHLRPLSSLIHVTVGGPPLSFVEGHIGGSLWTGLPPGGDPFVHHSVTHTEDEHELGLSPSLSFFPASFLLVFPLISLLEPNQLQDSALPCQHCVAKDLQQFVNSVTFGGNHGHQALMLLTLSELSTCVCGCFELEEKRPRDTWRSGADCPNAILVSATVKPGVVDGHHAPGLRRSARDNQQYTKMKTQSPCSWMNVKYHAEAGNISVFVWFLSICSCGIQKQLV